jgi:hypothetical protein
MARSDQRIFALLTDVRSERFSVTRILSPSPVAVGVAETFNATIEEIVVVVLFGTTYLDVTPDQSAVAG